MLTQELSSSVERTLITLAAFAWSAVLLLHFGLTTESVTLTLPPVTAMMAYWFAGSNATKPPKDNTPTGGT